MRKLKYFSTFSGIGGFELAIESVAKDLGIETECIGYSEIDPYAVSVYEKHFTNKNYGDITKIKTNTLPDFDLLVGGFPCQSHSMLGKRAGLDDSRGELFFDLARILKDKRPKYFVFENVKGLLSSNGGRAFEKILNTLDELGYYVAWRVLNATYFGSPQERERVAIIGVRGESAEPKVLFANNESFTKTHFEKARILSYSGNRNTVKLKNTVNTITASYRGLGTYNEPAILEADGRIRRFTPLECERLQGFPDNWTEYGLNNKRISDSRRYKMCGNAICIPMFQYVFKILFESATATTLKCS